MKSSLLCLLLAISVACSAQLFPIGHSTITFNDPARTGGYGSGGGPGRQIQTEIYYPGTSSGENVAVATGTFPLISFGHGFIMDWSSYQNIWEVYASNGFIIAFPRTEGDIGPVHSDFGKDLALVITKMNELNNNIASLFYQKLNGRSCISGHSMGGGSAYLGAQNNSSITAVMTFAAANTNPSAITASQFVTQPNLVIEGENDCVTPPPVHQDSIYNALSSSCKIKLLIKGASHCQFANFNLNCSLGEVACASPSITRAEQHDVMFDFTLLWLKNYLMDSCTSGNRFMDSLQTSQRVTSQRTCNIGCATAVVNNSNLDFELKLYPDPAKAYLILESKGEIVQHRLMAEITDLSGKRLMSQWVSGYSSHHLISINSLAPGIYFLRITYQGKRKVMKFMKE